MKQKIENLDNRKYVFWIMVSVLSFLLVFYVYSVGLTISNASRMANLESSISSIGSKVSDMEFKYISLKNDINIDLAYADGFKKVSDPIYIARGTDSQTLSFNSR